MNLVFFLIVLIAFGSAAWQQWQFVPTPGLTSPMDLLSNGMIAAASGAIELAIGLVGVLSLFMGLMKVAEQGGMLVIISRLIRPLMVRLFPDVPANHPAMGAMILNMSANALGLGNAATPFGIRAMQALDQLNPRPGTATNAMAMFLAINTAGVTLLPAKVIAIRAAAGSENAAGILPTTLFATVLSTLAAILAAWLMQRYFPVGVATPAELEMKRPWIEDDGASANAPKQGESADQAVVQSPAQAAPLADDKAYPNWVCAIAMGALVLAVPASIVWGHVIAPWIIPVLMVSFLLFGWLRGVHVYESFVEGAKDGFQVALRIMPYLVAILVAVGMLRSSGALDVIVQALAVFTGPLGLPAEALPMALLRPLSGSGAYGVMSAIIQDPAIGPDSYIGYLVTTIQGSSETTFYVLAVYFGAVQIRRIRHTLIAALIADVVAVASAVAICRYLYG